MGEGMAIIIIMLIYIYIYTRLRLEVFFAGPMAEAETRALAPARTTDR